MRGTAWCGSGWTILLFRLQTCSFFNPYFLKNPILEKGYSVPFTLAREQYSDMQSVVYSLKWYDPATVEELENMFITTL